MENDPLFANRGIIKNALYECSECKDIVAGRDLDWFPNDPDDIFICLTCHCRCKFERVEGEAKPVTRHITITDEEGIILDEFIVSDEDARKIADGFSTDWMDEKELKEYLEGA